MFVPIIIHDTATERWRYRLNSYFRVLRLVVRSKMKTRKMAFYWFIKRKISAAARKYVGSENMNRRGFYRSRANAQRSRQLVNIPTPAYPCSTQSSWWTTQATGEWKQSPAETSAFALTRKSDGFWNCTRSNCYSLFYSVTVNFDSKWNSPDLDVPILSKKPKFGVRARLVCFPATDLLTSAAKIRLVFDKERI